MLKIHGLCKSFGDQPVLKDVSFTLSAGECIGLAGPNGCGKTTLLRLITGAETPDRGAVQLSPPSLRLGYLPQGFSLPAETTFADYLTQMQGDLPALARRLEELAQALASGAPHPALQREYDAVLERMALASENAGRAPAALAGLGLADIPPDLPLGKLSGGQKTRLALAGALIADPQLLLLDEPTNHLDLEMLEWLEGWLTDPATVRRRAVLLVSHDRLFLDRTVQGILELDPLTHTARLFAGNYTAYLEQKQSERQQQFQDYQDQQDEIVRLQQAALHYRGIAVFRKGGKADGGDKFARGFFANRGLATVRRAKSIEKRVERLLTVDKIDKPPLTWQMKAEFGAAELGGKDALRLVDLAVGYGETVLLSGLNLTLRRGERAALVGPNGCGKSTLLRTLMGVIPPLSGEYYWGAGVTPGYMAQEQEELNPMLDALTAVRRLAPFSETEARAFLHRYLFSGDDVFTPTGSLSYGERARLSLACLEARGCNFLLLDEPLNHLDIPSRNRFEQALDGFPGAVLAVVHDRYFIDRFARLVWRVENGGLQLLQA